MPKVAKTLDEMIKEYENKPTVVLTDSDFPTKELEHDYRVLVGLYRSATNERKRKISKLTKKTLSQTAAMIDYYNETDKNTEKLRDAYLTQFEEKNIFLDHVRDERIDLLKKIYFVDSEQKNFNFVDGQLIYITKDGHKIVFPELIDLMFHNNIIDKTFSGKEHEVMFRKFTHFDLATKYGLTEKVDMACESLVLEKLMNLNSDFAQKIQIDDQLKEYKQEIEKLNKKAIRAKKFHMKKRAEKLTAKSNEISTMYEEAQVKIQAEKEIIDKIKDAISAFIKLNEYYSSNKVSQIEKQLETDLVDTEHKLYNARKSNEKKAEKFVEQTSDASIKKEKIKKHTVIYGEYKKVFDSIVKNMMKDSKAFGSFLVTIGEKFENLDSIKAPLEEKELVKYLRSTFAQHLVERDKKELKEKRIQNLKPFTKNNAEK